MSSAAWWDRLRSVGPDLPGGPRPRRLHPLHPGGRRYARGSVDAGRPAVPHPRAPARSLLRAGAAADRPAFRARARSSTRCTGSARSTSATCSASSTAPRTPRARRRRGAVTIGDEDPAFAGGSYVIVQKYLHDLTAWDALPGGGAGACDRSHQAQRHRAARRRQADQLTRRAQHDRRRGRRGARHRALQHAVRPRQRCRVRHLLHRLRPRPGCDRADAAGTCSSATRPATTTGSSTSQRRSPGTCSSCRPSICSTAWRIPSRPRPLAATAPIDQTDDGSLGIGGLKGASREPPASFACADQRGGWELLDEEARQRLTPALGARKLVDFRGPARLGALGDEPRASGAAQRAMPAACRRSSGASCRWSSCAQTSACLVPSFATPTAAPTTSTSTPLDAAAHQIAVAESAAVFHGWADAFTGIVDASPHDTRSGASPSGYPDRVAQRVELLLGVGVAGPYALAVGSEQYRRCSTGLRARRLPAARAP